MHGLEHDNERNLNWRKVSREEQAQRRRNAREHLEFCVKLFQMQKRSGRYFLHEHWQFATPWREDIMTKLGAQAGVMFTSADQCAYGLATQGPHGTAPAQKPTRFVTNPTRILSELKRKCPTGSHTASHDTNTFRS